MGKLYVTGSVYAVVALERFLAVEAGAGDCSRRVIVFCAVKIHDCTPYVVRLRDTYTRYAQ